METLNKSLLEDLIKKVIAEQLDIGGIQAINKTVDPSGVISVSIPTIKVTEEDRLDTGSKEDIVYTKDIFTLKESPRLGCGVMEMDDTTFDWTLKYDEIDYVIEGQLDILVNGKTISAGEGEVIFIPRDSKIQFSVKNHARFLYITYPADWAKQ
ncbi:cupin domain-containing protein [Neobacillus sp. OS1-32]|uniref:cupin domain-containing protein n=1 Tax=Neobacillus sp. OS1-32 TaxID=3070682 RepID=UPI0027E11F7F|nr:cupin domain-containing protein [Neobacillus sp. OS1-32]WML28982.1 cupin domain-containing protein [Neobacillus sp. OS1-32]